jgi:hypothetical protein
VNTPAPAPTPVLDLGTLSSVLRVLPIRPSWTEVQGALARAQTHKNGADDYNGRDSDEQLVKDFAEVLRKNAPLLHAALVCGAAIGAHASGTRGERIVQGLAALSRAYGFADKQEAAVQADLDAVAKILAQRYQVGPLDALRALAPGNGLREWTATVTAGITQAESAVKGVDVATIRSIAWESVRERLVATLAVPMSAPGASIEELMAHAARLSPAGVIDLRPVEMRFLDWSRAFWASAGTSDPADPSYAPLWLTVVALRWLGFAVTNDKEIRTWLEVGPRGNKATREALDEAVQLLERSAVLRTSPATQAALVWPRSDASLVTEWRLGTRVAALAMEDDPMQRRTARFNPDALQTLIPATPLPSIFAIEEPHDVDQEKMALSIHQRASRAESVGPAQLVRFARTPPTTESRGAFIVDPRSPDDLVPATQSNV